jgi:L-asparaginase
MAREIYQGLKNYDGVVLLHGTDTMAYTASMLSFMLQGLNKPVILTGSQLPIVDEDTDARDNLVGAFLAANKEISGVYVFFGGRLIKGTRAVKTKTMSFDAFESINSADAGLFREGTLYLNDVSLAEVNTETALDDKIVPDVFLLKLIPGTKEEFFKYFTKMGYKGLVIEAFGLGGMHYVRRDLINGIKNLIAENIPIVITTQCLYELSDPTVYEVGRKAYDEGVILGQDMTSEAAVTKLMWVLGHTKDMSEIKKLMQKNLCGELSS